MTVAVTFSLIGKGKLLFIVRRCARKMRQNIRTAFGKYVELVVGSGSVMNRAIHARKLLPTILRPFVKDIRAKHGLPDDSCALYIEDLSTTHCEDSCRNTNDSGLQEVRKQEFAEQRVMRSCCPPNGTPETSPQIKFSRFLKQWWQV